MDDDFSEIERRIRELRNQYPNSEESVRLHGRLAPYRQDPAYQDRYRKALAVLNRVGFKAGRRTGTFS